MDAVGIGKLDVLDFRAQTVAVEFIQQRGQGVPSIAC
jgi:hypothetical protein